MANQNPVSFAPLHCSIPMKNVMRVKKLSHRTQTSSQPSSQWLVGGHPQSLPSHFSIQMPQNSHTERDSQKSSLNLSSEKTIPRTSGKTTCKHSCIHIRPVLSCTIYINRSLRKSIPQLPEVVSGLKRSPFATQIQIFRD